MESLKKYWKTWFFLIFLNTIAISGAFYLKSIGIDIYAFRGGSWFSLKDSAIIILIGKNFNIIQMKATQENNFKKTLDNILIFNLYILIVGAIFLATSFFLSVNGNSNLYNLFQKLWYPIFIPSLSLFFTAILIEAIITQLINRREK